MLLYDPRFNRKMKTNNPAIILADKVVKSNLVHPDEDFWNRIKKLANYADFNVKEKNMVRSRVQKTKKT